MNRARFIRDEWDLATGKDLKTKLREVPVATEEELHEISCRLNAAIAIQWPEARGQSTFFKLFRFMDADDSGLVSYMELLHMIRNHLHLSPSKLPTAHVQGLWRALDEDESGTICAGEFIQMMRKGYLLRMRGEVSGELAYEATRPPWSPSVSVVHTDRGTPEQERAQNLDELRKATRGHTAKLEEQAREFERRIREAQRAAEASKPKDVGPPPRRASRRGPTDRQAAIREEVKRLAVNQKVDEMTRAPKSAAAKAALDMLR